MGPSHGRRHVINGTVVSRPGTTVPWAVSIYYGAGSTSRPRFICTATAIGPLEVLTAAHCVDGPGFFYVVTNTDSLGRGRLVALEAIDVNGTYRSTATKDDVAIVRPLERLNLTSYAKLGSPTMAAKVRSGALPKLTLYGWGRTETGELTGHLRTASLVRQTRAAQVEFEDWFVDSLMLAAGRYDPATRLYHGACHGDSGGPLVVHVLGVPYVVGVTSFGSANCNLPTPTIFTSVGNYSTWIGTSRRNLPALAQRSNRAVPILRTAPAIVGTVAVGSTLTCGPGTWTANAREMTYNWTRSPTYVEIARGPTYLVTAADAGKKLMCNVSAVSDVGSTKATTSVVAGVLPTATFGQSVQIVGLSPSTDPVPDQLATCVAPTFEYADPATLTYNWYTKLTGDRQLLQSGPTVLLTKELMIAMQNFQLICEVTAGNTMGSTATTGYTVMPVLVPVMATASIATVPIVTGSVATCAGVSTSPTATLAFEWALEPAFAAGSAFSSGATPLGTGPTYTLTDADVVALGASRLACRATATIWHSSFSTIAAMA
ncbi:MAG: trypsin-like serine protease [Mycobacteriales bacterium]